MDSKVIVSIELYEQMVADYNKKFSKYLKATGIKKTQLYQELESDNMKIEQACKLLPKKK